MDGRGPPPLGGGGYVPGGGGGAIYGPGADGWVRCVIALISGGLTRHLAHARRGVHCWKRGMRSARQVYARQTHHSAEASSVDNASGACRARAYTCPVGVAPFRASLATRGVRIRATLSRSSNNTAPDQGSIEGKRTRSCEIAPPVEPSPPRTRVVGSVGGREGRDVVNAVVWQGAGQANCENNVSHCMATSSLDHARIPLTTGA